MMNSNHTDPLLQLVRAVFNVSFFLQLHTLSTINQGSFGGKALFDMKLDIHARICVADRDQTDLARFGETFNKENNRRSGNLP